MQHRAPVSLTGSRLGFDREGRRLFVIEPDALVAVDLQTHTTRRLDHANARALVVHDDQLWIATDDDQLVRMDLAGRVIGEPHALPFAATALFVPAPCGPAAAVWASTPAVAFVDDLGALHRSEVTSATDAEPDAVLPLTGRRHAIARGSRLALPSGMTVTLPAGSSVAGGVVMADGKTATVLVAGAGGRQLLSIALAASQIVQRFAVGIGPHRVALQRGLVLSQLGPRTLQLADLRNGRELGVTELDDDLVDFAIDREAIRCVLRGRSGAVEVRLIAELQRGPAAVAVAVSVAPTPPGAEREGALPAAPVASQSAAVAPHAVPTLASSAAMELPVLRALEPRPALAPIERAVATANLDRELHGVGLWLLAAIAHGWDTRRIGYGNEGQHPFELEVAAILGLATGHATAHVASARERLAAHELALAAEPSWRGLDTPIGRLAHELGLSKRALDILLVVAAPTLRGELARLIGVLANDPARGLDELVVHQVLGSRHDRDDLAAELDPSAPLVRLGLVHVSPKRARPFAELSIDPAIVDRLRAKPPHLGAATTRRPADVRLAELDIPVAALQGAAAALSRPTREPARIVVRGRAGAGRTTLLAAACADAGRELAVIDAHALPRTADAFVAELAGALRRALLVGLVPCVVHLDEVIFDGRAASEVAGEALRLHPGPIAAVLPPGATAPFGAGHLAIELPVLAETERRDVWRRALADAGLALDDADALAARYRIGPGVIRRAIAAAREAEQPAMATSTIEAFIRQTRDTRLGQFARRVERLPSWSNVVLPSDILDSLRELVGRVRHGRLVYDTWGMSRTVHSSRGLTALFQGSPGTGKTLVAGVIARELGLDLYQVDLSKVMSKWIGETERNLATVFDAAEDGQVVLLFDEADSLFAKRTEVRSSNDRYANLEVNYLLQRVDAFEGIAILTTNHGTSIDQAFKRRLSFRLSFPFPDEDTRAQLWQAHLPPELPTAGPLVFETLARKYQLSGGYIRNACLRAAFLAAQEELPLRQDHLERAVALEFAELGKLTSSGSLD